MEFQVRRKVNKKLKYIKKVSTPKNATFKAIPKIICNGIEKLTSRIEKNSQIKVNNKYPGRANDLIQVG